MKPKALFYYLLIWLAFVVGIICVHADPPFSLTPGGGSSLPANAAGALTNDGVGNLSWSSSSATPGFNTITSGTNTTAAMVVGTGSSLTISGSGTINGTSLLGATWASPAAIGTGTPAAITGTTITATTGFSGPGGSVTGVNASQLLSATWASPLALGSTTPAAVTGTTITANTGFSGPGSSITALNASNLSSGTVAVARLANITNTQLSGTAGITSANLANTAVTAASYGDSTHVGSFTVNAQGQITAASNVVISGGGGGLTGVLTSVTIVDGTNGNDGTGVAGDLAHPFLTIGAAITATSAPSYVEVRPNSTAYNEKITMKNNVPVYFDSGATINYTGSSGDTVVFPATSGQSYFLLGHGQIISTNSTGSAYAISGGVSGTGYMIIEADVVAGRGTNGNSACNLSNIDSTVFTTGFSRIEIGYVEGNTKATQDVFVCNYLGGAARIKIGAINCLSTANQAGAFTVTDTSPVNGGTLDIDIGTVVSVGVPTSVNNGTVHLNVDGNVGIKGKINYIFSGAMTAINIGSNCDITSFLIQNNSATYGPINGGSITHGPGIIRNALIQNVSSGQTPFLNGHNTDHSLILINDRFENPNSSPSNSPFVLVQDSSSFDIFDSCKWYMASTNANGVVDLETNAAALFKGQNIMIRRAGTAPMLNSSAAHVAQLFGTVYSPQALGSNVTILDGTYVNDTSMTLANSLGIFF